VANITDLQQQLQGAKKDKQEIFPHRRREKLIFF